MLMHKVMGSVLLRAMRFCILTTVALVSTVCLSNAATPAPLTYGAWSFECKPRSGSTENICVANQLVTTGGNTKSVIIGVMVAYMADHPLPHIIFRVSPNANINKGAAIKVDEHAYLHVPISNCDNHICEVRSFIPEGVLLQMRKGKLLQFAFFIDDKQVTYPVSLEGFDKSYMALQSNLK